KREKMEPADAMSRKRYKARCEVARQLLGPRLTKKLADSVRAHPESMQRIADAATEPELDQSCHRRRTCNADLDRDNESLLAETPKPGQYRLPPTNAHTH